MYSLDGPTDSFGSIRNPPQVDHEFRRDAVNRDPKKAIQSTMIDEKSNPS
jgi:hypothetical protein